MEPVARIPDKHYFKIGEVAQLAGVEPYVIRYWESEFRSLRPQKSRTNQRLFRRKDVERILEIRRLLYEEGYKIEGARRRLEGREEPAAEVTAGDVADGQKPGRSRRPAHEERSVAAIRQLLHEARSTVIAIEKILDEDTDS